MTIQLLTTEDAQPDYLELLLETPLTFWRRGALLDLDVSADCHVVRFVQGEQAVLESDR